MQNSKIQNLLKKLRIQNPQINPFHFYVDFCRNQNQVKKIGKIAKPSFINTNQFKILEIIFSCSFTLLNFSNNFQIKNNNLFPRHWNLQCLAKQHSTQQRLEVQQVLWLLTSASRSCRPLLTGATNGIGQDVLFY